MPPEPSLPAPSLHDQGPPPPCPARFNLAAHALFAGQPGAKIALTVAGPDGAALERWSYDRLREAVARAAGALLAAGLPPGGRVMLRMGATADFPVAFLGAVAAGGVAVPTSAQLTPREAGAVARALRPDLVVLAPELAAGWPEGGWPEADAREGGQSGGGGSGGGGSGGARGGSAAGRGSQGSEAEGRGSDGDGAGGRGLAGAGSAGAAPWRAGSAGGGSAGDGPWRAGSPPARGAGPAGGRVLAPDALARGPERGPADTGADDPAFMVFTSGSSGGPKGVVHAQRAAWARRMMWTGWYGLGPDDLMLHAGAFNWTYTLGAGLLDPWGAGASTLVHSGPRDPGVWARLAAAHGPSLFAATPGVYRQLLKYGRGVGPAFAALRHGLTAGEKLPEAVAQAWAAETGKPLFEALGMSEISTYLSSGPAAPPRPGWIGPPQPGRRVAVLTPGGTTPAPRGEVGELAVSARDPGLMLGYLDAGLPLRGEWFVTGDLAEMAADGYVAYRGRADDLMNPGGFRVAPQEVEDVLLAHPAVSEAAVAEVEVAGGARVIGAWVVAEGAGPEALAAWCAARLADYKRPRRITLVAALPRTATGKVIRRDLAGG